MFSAQADKAIVAGIVAGIAAIVATGGHYTVVNVLGIAGAILGTWQATYWTSNADTPATVAPVVPLASATPIHDAMVAEYTATPEPTP
jgi:uncharacterized membrane protein YeaQ/YmgE (transglycosylase-associated protein family)